MSVWDKYECEGQLSLFDFIESPKQENNVDRQRKIEQEVVDNVLNWTIRCVQGWSKLSREERIEQAKIANNHSGGGRSDYMWQCNLNGIDITFDKPIGKCIAVHIGWPMFDDRVFGRECKFSGHTCNREELWKIAESLEVDCIKQCCRNCKVKCCGARCNGSEEPSKCYSCFHEDQGKCWCRQSEHFEKYVPSKPCTYLDMC